MGVITPGGGGGGGGNYTLISRTKVTSPVTQVTFSAIPQTFTDLVVVTYGAFSDSAAQENVVAIFNADVGANYNYQRDTSDFGSAGTGTYSPGGQSVASTTGLILGQLPAASAASTAAGLSRGYIANYASATLWKALFYESYMDIGAGGAPHPRGQRGGGTWMSTAAITSMEVFDGAGGNFIVGSEISLFGVS